MHFKTYCARVLLALFLSPSSYIFADDIPKFSLLSTGKLPLYEYDGEKRQDISGITYGNGIFILGDDGGKNSQYPELRIADMNTFSAPATILQRQVIQKDIEAATFLNDNFYIAASMSDVNEEADAYRVLAELKIDPATRKVTAERYVYMRDPIIHALQIHFKNPAWYGRISTTFGKEGGLNVEGLSTSHSGNDYLAIGLRSPLWSSSFGSPKFGKGFTLNNGDAIILNIQNPFDSKPNITVNTINLAGAGFRSLEYIENLKGYIAISGSVEKDSGGFKLWWISSNYTPYEINMPEFKNLCRPESVVHIPESRQIFVVSEESGTTCEHSKYTYLKLSY